MSPLNSIAAVVLDLDDTLYLERDYVLSGFAAVGAHIGGARGDAFLKCAWGRFLAGERGDTFDRALEDIGLADGSIQVADLVGVYRRHAPAISLCPDADQWIARHGASKRLAIITDGPVDSQSRKLQSLGLVERVAHRVMTDEYGIEFRKPHERSFRFVESLWPDLRPEQFAYLADNPKKDFITPNRRGWTTIRIQRPLGEHFKAEGVDDAAPGITLESFEALM